jgi:hypothetical protein
MTLRIYIPYKHVIILFQLNISSKCILLFTHYHYVGGFENTLKGKSFSFTNKMILLLLLLLTSKPHYLSSNCSHFIISLLLHALHIYYKSPINWAYWRSQCNTESIQYLMPLWLSTTCWLLQCLICCWKKLLKCCRDS